MKSPVAALPFLAAIAVCLGCSSTRPGSASFASVVIQHHSLSEVQDATLQVFRENGYQGQDLGAGSMVFEKEGSQFNDIAYNGVVGSYYGERTKLRAKVQLVYLDSGSCRLQCQAFTIRNAGDSFFEDEIPMTNLRSGSYQSMLNQVAKKLK